MDANNKRKRKKRKSFLVNARGYGKKGHFGGGSSVDAETYQYFINVLEQQKVGIPEEEKETFANNVLSQIEGNETTIICNQVGSRVIENLLPSASDETIVYLISAIESELRPLLTDRYASHVLEMLLTEISKRCSKDSQTEHLVSLKKFFLKISKFLLNNLEDFIDDTFANFVTRHMLKLICGYSENGKKIEGMVEHPDLIETAKEFGVRIRNWPQLKDLPYKEASSGLLQVLIESLSQLDCDVSDDIILGLVKNCFVKDEDSKLSDFFWIFETKSLAQLLEACLKAASPEIFSLMLNKYFFNHIKELALTREGNFAVQKLVNSCSNKEEFIKIFEEISSYLKDILQLGYTGVLVSLSEACKRLKAKQHDFLTGMVAALNCSDSEQDFFEYILKLVPKKETDLPKEANSSLQINIHGSIIFQNMLAFNKPIKLVKILLDQNLSRLVPIFCDQKGSRIVDAYMTSEFIGEKSREQLIKKLQGSYQELVKSKHGSRAFDQLWSKASTKQKLQIASELSEKAKLWSSTPSGTYVARNIMLQLYQRNKDEWKEAIEKHDKNRSKNIKNLFEDLLK